MILFIDQSSQVLNSLFGNILIRIFETQNTVHPPLCQIFMAKKSRDKSGFGKKSGCDKSGDAL